MRERSIMRKRGRESEREKERERGRESERARQKLRERERDKQGEGGGEGEIDSFRFFVLKNVLFGWNYFFIFISSMGFLLPSYPYISS